MDFERLKELNPDIPLYSVTSPEFNNYGRLLDLDTEEIVEVGSKTELPNEGAKYDASFADFEALELARTIKNNYFGQLDIQVGYCRGHANFMNAWEWHTSSEVNVAVTDLVLILGKITDLTNGTVDSETAKAFYLKKGEAVEVYSTTLHFCPCEVSKNGFACVVALPKGTNTPLDEPSDDKRLTHKNKWLIAHCQNDQMLANGRVAGITGENIEIKY